MKKIVSLIKNIWDFIFKTEQGLYLIFGVLTTLVSLIVFWLFNNLIFIGELVNVSTVLKHIAGIIFAYFTNRTYVFKSENVTKSAKAKEASLFVITRIGTLLIDLWIIDLLIDKGVSENIGTIFTSIIVIILNYIASKLYIFKRKD